MKSPTMLAAFLVVLLVCRRVRCDKEATCELGAFVENEDGSNSVLIDAGPVLAEKLPDTCGDGELCSSIVQQQASEGTGSGDFTLLVDEREGYTVGDVLCDKAENVLRGSVWQKVVRIYWRLCGSGWSPTSFRMPQLLCCDDGLQVACDKRDEL